MWHLSAASESRRRLGLAPRTIHYLFIIPLHYSISPLVVSGRILGKREQAGSHSQSQGGASASGAAEPNLVVPSEWLPLSLSCPAGSLPKVRGGQLFLQLSRLKPIQCVEGSGPQRLAACLQIDGARPFASLPVIGLAGHYASLNRCVQLIHPILRTHTCLTCLHDGYATFCLGPLIYTAGG
ncbi:hypothetical protein ASPBRDRAFT_515533 [Aspergillus brasiliensis CBS 101740]|uniref:Uncharacterized protein n=1 Tax=Aspergillus brasiliensis (strain CBS 101740 / IMI 381727 / IBT 21946) TaxID=767769 RepID=A0A1L9UPY0_ASPBC|nr:hypothetical protein ASPBRDRAFT_515533 [Aspergillus brasiliensis CBS 101740]